ncbi:MAG: hypothetical protein ACLU4P_04275 [Ruminococcus sp.]
MLGYLAKIELTYDEETNEIVAPTFRQDIHCMADVAEEIARFYGYDKIPDHTSHRRSYHRKASVQASY